MNNNVNQINCMNGIRGIASLVVLLSHLQLTFLVDFEARLLNIFSFLPKTISFTLTYFFMAFVDGNFSVWLFWVMSGFVLSFSYFRRRNNDLLEANVQLLASSIKRYFRLMFPVLISVIFAYLLLKNNLMTNKLLASQFGEKYINGWLGFFYSFDASLLNAIKSALWDSFFNYNPNTTYNAVLWTMQPEFFGSLFVFSFLSLTGSNNIRYILYPVTAGVIYGLEIHWLNSFLFGVLLCDLYINTNVIKIINILFNNLFTCIFTLFLFLILVGMPNHNGILHFTLSILFILFVLSSKIMNKAFSSRHLLFLGKISFPLYLVHLPIICSATGTMYLSLYLKLGHDISVLLSVIFTILMSFILAFFLSKIGDEVGIKLADYISGKISKIS